MDLGKGSLQLIFNLAAVGNVQGQLSERNIFTINGNKTYIIIVHFKTDSLRFHLLSPEFFLHMSA